jgi:hypothetical protein
MLSGEERRQISEIDDALLYFEFLSLMDEKIEFQEEPSVFSRPDFQEKDFLSAEKEFLLFFKNIR